MSSVELVHRFGGFELDLRSRELRFGSDRVPLQPRVFSLLCYLAARPGQAISREQLLAEVWADAVVTDASLTKAVRALRAVLLKDPSLGDAIATVRGHGYRFCSSETRADGHSPARERRDADGRPFVGRAGELAKIAALASGVRRGGRGVLLLLGEPGIGKTALARQSLAVAAPDFLVGRGQCIEGDGEQSPYLPIAEALVDFARTGTEHERARVRAILQRTAPSFSHRLPALFPDEARDLPLVELRPEQIGLQLLAVLEQIGAERPMALVLDDIQWADRSTLELIHGLMRRNSPSRLLTICTMRTAELDRSEFLGAIRADFARMEGGHVLEIRSIPIEGVREYAAWGLRREGLDSSLSSDRFVEWLHARTGGNPLFLTQLVDHLSSLGLLSRSGDTQFTADRLERAGIPSTLGQLIRHWAGRLGGTDRALLEAASVAGFYFDSRAIQAALELDGPVVEASCDRLCRDGWLHFRDFESWRDGSRGARLRFEHVLFREALYAELPPNRRAQLHLAIARRIQSGNPHPSAHSSELATHFELAGASEDGVRQRVAAAAFAALNRSVSETLHHVQRAQQRLACLPTGERAGAEVELHLSLGMAHAARSGFGDASALAAFERARVLARNIGDAEREISAVWGVASCQKMRGEIEAAREAGLRLRALAESTRDVRSMVLALDLLCSIAFYQGRFVECLALGERVDALCGDELDDAWLTRSLEDVRVTAQAYCAISEWHLGSESRALARIDDAVERAERLGHPYTSVFVDGFAACVAFLVGDSDAQRRHALRGRAASDESGIALWSAIHRFMALCSEPASETDLPGLRAAFGEMARFGGLGGTFFVELLAARELAAGHVEAAARLSLAGIERAERTTESHALPMLYAIAGQVEREETKRLALFEKAEVCAFQMGSVGLQVQIEAARRAASVVPVPEGCTVGS